MLGKYCLDASESQACSDVSQLGCKYGFLLVWGTNQPTSYCRTWLQCNYFVGRWGYLVGCGHRNIWIWLCLTCNQSGFQDSPKHPDGPLCIHHNKFRKCLQEKMEAWVSSTLSENADSSKDWGWGKYWVIREAFRVFCDAPSGSILNGLSSCGLTYGSYVFLSAVCHNRHWEFWTSTSIYFVSLSGTEDDGSMTN